MVAVAELALAYSVGKPKVQTDTGNTVDLASILAGMGGAWAADEVKGETIDGEAERKEADDNDKTIK